MARLNLDSCPFHLILYPEHFSKLLNSPKSLMHRIQILDLQKIEWKEIKDKDSFFLGIYRQIFCQMFQQFILPPADSGDMLVRL